MTEYKSYHITHWPKPIPDRQFDYDITHPDKDEWIEFAKSLDAAKTLIDDLIAENRAP